jgi:RimJ/RimL family protein N-acetyltransferase
MVVYETERLRARLWTLDDTKAAFAMYGDPEVVRYIGGELVADIQEQRDQLAGYLERALERDPALGWWAAERRSDGAVVGASLCKFLPGPDRQIDTEDIEVGWHLAREHWGHGYATEIGVGAVTHGFATLKVNEIVAVVEPPNVASQEVARRVGMRHVGARSHYYDGRLLEEFRIGRSQWVSILQRKTKRLHAV